jgi:hypothetical protein
MTLDEVITELKSLGNAAIDALQSDTLRKIADCIDDVNKIANEIVAEKAKLDALNPPPAATPPADTPPAQ